MKKEHFKAMRKAMGYNQRELAEALNLSTNGKESVSKIERGINNPSGQTEKLMRYLAVFGDIDDTNIKSLETVEHPVKKGQKIKRITIIYGEEN